MWPNFNKLTPRCLGMDCDTLYIYIQVDHGGWIIFVVDLYANMRFDLRAP